MQVVFAETVARSCKRNRHRPVIFVARFLVARRCHFRTWSDLSVPDAWSGPGWPDSCHSTLRCLARQSISAAVPCVIMLMPTQEYCSAEEHNGRHRRQHCAQFDTPTRGTRRRWRTHFEIWINGVVRGERRCQLPRPQRFVTWNLGMPVRRARCCHSARSRGGLIAKHKPRGAPK